MDNAVVSHDGGSSARFIESVVFDFDPEGPKEGAGHEQLLPAEFQKLVSKKGGASGPVPPGRPKPSKSGGRKTQTSRPSRTGATVATTSVDGPGMDEAALSLSGVASGASSLYGHLPSRQAIYLPSESPRNPNGNVRSPSKKRARAVRAEETPEINDTPQAPARATPRQLPEGGVSGWDGSRPELFSGDHEDESSRQRQTQNQEQQEEPQEQQQRRYMGNTVMPNWRKGIVEKAPFDPRHQAEALVKHWEQAHGKAIAEVGPLRKGMVKFREILNMVSINDIVQMLIMISVSFDAHKESVDSTAKELGKVVTEECHEWGQLVDELRNTMAEWLDESKRHLRTVCDGLENANFRFQALTYKLADTLEKLKNAEAEIVRLNAVIDERDQAIIDIKQQKVADERMFIEIIKGKRLRTEGARTIQKRWRKIEPRIRKYHADRKFVSVSIQRIFRGKRIRRQYSDALEDHRVRVRSVRKIEREVRRYLIYLHIEENKAQVKLFRKSAKAIQKVWRVKLARWELARRKEREATRLMKVSICLKLRELRDMVFHVESTMIHNKKKAPEAPEVAHDPSLGDIKTAILETLRLSDELSSAVSSHVDLQKTQLRQLKALQDERHADQMGAHHFGFDKKDPRYHLYSGPARPHSGEGEHAHPAGYKGSPEMVAASQSGLPANIAVTARPGSKGSRPGSKGLRPGTGGGGVVGRGDDASLSSWDNAAGKDGAPSILVRDALNSDLPGHTRSLEEGVAETGDAHEALLSQFVSDLNLESFGTEEKEHGSKKHVAKLRHHGMSDLQYSEVLEQAKEGLNALKTQFDHKLELGEAPTQHAAMEWLENLPCQALVKRITLFDAIERKEASFAPTWLSKFANIVFRKLIPEILPKEFHPGRKQFPGATDTPLSIAAANSPIAALGYAVPEGPLYHTMQTVQESGMFGAVPAEWYPCGFICHEPGRETHQHLLRLHGLPNIVDQMLTDVAVFASQRGDDPEGRLLAHVFRIDVGTAALGFTVFIRAMLNELGFVYRRRSKLRGSERTRVHQAAKNIHSASGGKGMGDYTLSRAAGFKPNPDMIADPVALGLCSDNESDDGSDNGYISDGDIAHMHEVTDHILEQLRPADQPRAPSHISEEKESVPELDENEVRMPLEQENISVYNALMVLAVLFHAEPDAAVAAAADLETTLLGGGSTPSKEDLAPFEQAVVALLLKPRVVNLRLNTRRYGGLEYDPSKHSAIKDTFEAFATSAADEGPLKHTKQEMIPVATLVLLCLRIHDQQTFHLQVASWATHTFLVSDKDYDGRITLEEFRKAAAPAMENLRKHNVAEGVDLDAMFEEAVYNSTQAALNSAQGKAQMASKYAARTSRLVKSTMPMEAYQGVMQQIWGMIPDGVLAIRKEQSKDYEL